MDGEEVGNDTARVACDGACVSCGSPEKDQTPAIRESNDTAAQESALRGNAEGQLDGSATGSFSKSLKRKSSPFGCNEPLRRTRAKFEETQFGRRGI